jgi:hypothetical protein
MHVTNFLAIFTFSVLPVTWLRFKIRKTKKNLTSDLALISLCLWLNIPYVGDQQNYLHSFHLPPQQMEVRDLWENQATLPHCLSFLCIWWLDARNSFLLFNFQIHITSRHLTTCILYEWTVSLLLSYYETSHHWWIIYFYQREWMLATWPS